MRALVIGGTSGLGRVLAAELVSAGWDVTATGVREEAIRDFCAAFPSARADRLDLSVQGAHARTEALIAAAGGADAVAVCAGLYEDNPSAEWPADERSIMLNAAGCAPDT